MARYIPQTYSNRLSAELQKQANDLVPVLEKAGSLEECYSLVQQFTAQTKATAYIEDDYGDILYSSDKLTITTDKDSIVLDELKDVDFLRVSESEEDNVMYDNLQAEKTKITNKIIKND